MPRHDQRPYDVAIVGCGPTGAALANLLGMCGLRVVVLERDRDSQTLPRAVHFDGEVMRIFQTIGVADRVAAVSRINAGMRFVDPGGKLLLNWPRPQQVGPQGWHPSYRFHQPDLEAIVRDRLRNIPNVDVLLGADAMSIGDLPDAQALAPGHIWHRLARWLTPSDAEVERAAVYTFHSVISSSWRRGRLLIAGDAAHQSPPFMGQGMCAGIRDAANLAWKLAHCIRHGHDDAILDSYQSERHPHVRAFIKGAIDLGRLVNASDSEAALQSAFRQPDGTHKMTTIAPRLGPGLWQTGCAAAGNISRQLRFHSGGLSDDLASYRPALLVDRALLARWNSRALVEKKGIHVWDSGDLDGSAEYLAELGAPAVAIRPDRYVYGTAHDAASLDTLVEGLPPNPVRT